MIVKVLGDADATEYQSCLRLKALFEEAFSDAKGKIIIYCGAVLFGSNKREMDIIVIGSFENTKRINVKLGERKTPLMVHNFVFVIDDKRHTGDRLELVGPNLRVKYEGEFVDASKSSHAQSVAVHKFIKIHTSPNVYAKVCHFLWLSNVSTAELKNRLKAEGYPISHNLLPSDVDVSWLFSLACCQQEPERSDSFMGDGELHFYSFKDSLQNHLFSGFDQAFDLFSKSITNLGQVTREKLEKITEKLLDEQKYAKAIGEKLVVIRGRAGTGKTIKLLRIAYDLAVNHSKRCLMLTYNKALVSDIRRLIALTRMPEDVDSYTVSIQTSDKYFRDLLIATGVISSGWVAKDFPNEMR